MATPILSPFKTCSKCGLVVDREFAADYFVKNSRASDGLASCCKACKKKHYAENKEQYERNRDKYLETHREEYRAYKARYHVEHREKNRAYSVKYRSEHKEELKANRAEYYVEHKDEYRRKAAKYRAEHKQTLREKQRPLKAARRARERSAAGQYNTADVELQIKAQTDKKNRLRCWWCGKVIKNNKYHIDHKIPLIRGGSNGPENICISHGYCNRSKGRKTPQELGRLL